MGDLSKYLAQANAWVGATKGDKAYTEMLNWFDKNKQGYKHDSQNCCEFTVACALKAFGLDQKYIPVINYANGQSKMWKSLSRNPVKGALMYFDYKDGNGISHVEIVEKVEGTGVYTINGNQNGKVVKKVWPVNYKYIAGYGVPAWPKEEEVSDKEIADAVAQYEVLKKGSSGPYVLLWQKYLQKKGFYKAGYLDGKFGDYMDSELRKFQKANSLFVDGIIGKNCWAFARK